MSVFSLVQAFQCLTFNKNLSGYNFFFMYVCIYVFISVVVSILEKESFLFCSFLGAQKFPPNFELVKKSYSDLSFSKYHAPIFECGVGVWVWQWKVANSNFSHACSYRGVHRKLFPSSGESCCLRFSAI